MTYMLLLCLTNLFLKGVNNCVVVNMIVIELVHLHESMYMCICMCMYGYVYRT